MQRLCLCIIYYRWATWWSVKRTLQNMVAWSYEKKWGLRYVMHSPRAIIEKQKSRAQGLHVLFRLIRLDFWESCFLRKESQLPHPQQMQICSPKRRLWASSFYQVGCVKLMPGCSCKRAIKTSNGTVWMLRTQFLRLATISSWVWLLFA